MSKDISAQLSDALHRIANQTTPVTDATAAVVHRAGRLRRRRRATTAVVGAAALAVVVPVGIALLPPGSQDSGLTTMTTRQATPPSTRSTQQTSAPAPQATRGTDGVLATTIDFSKFPRGKAPAVPWYDNGVIHDGDREIPFEGGFPYIDSLQEIRGGYLVLVDHKDILTWNRELFFVTPDGEQRSLDLAKNGLIYPPTVSDDGSQFAWSTMDGGLSDNVTTLRVADGATGEIIRTKQIPGDQTTLVSVAGFASSRVVLNRATNAASKPIKVWDPATNTIREWYDAYALTGLDTGRSVAAVQLTGAQRLVPCGAVIELPEQREQWRDCGHIGNYAVFSPDGRFVASASDGAVHVLAARSGEPVLRIGGTAPLDVAWEPGGDLLFVALDEKTDRRAIVRCSPTGACELATEPKPSKKGQWPYQIGVRR